MIVSGTQIRLPGWIFVRALKVVKTTIADWSKLNARGIQNKRNLRGRREYNRVRGIKFKSSSFEIRRANFFRLQNPRRQFLSGEHRRLPAGFRQWNETRNVSPVNLPVIFITFHPILFHCFCLGKYLK